MAAKIVSPAVQTYRVGVQNRYSAFLEGEEGLALSNSVKRPATTAINKQKAVVNGQPKSTSIKTNGKSELSSSSSSSGANKKQDAQVKSSSLANGQPGQVKGGGDTRRPRRDGNKTQQQSSGATQTQQPRNQSNRNRGQGKDGNTADAMTRSPRNQMNGNSSQHLDASQQNQRDSKENRSPRGGANNPRFNRPRNQNSDRRADQSQQDVQQMNGHLPSSEGDKARHQQRRMNNLRFKDPEKRERRAQVSEGTESLPKPESQTESEVVSGDQRGLRVKRDGDRNPDSKNKVATRPRRLNQNGSEPNAERRDGRRDRPPPRSRNELGGSRSEGGRHDKPKPIPNFSDKSDFPSLAS